MTEANGKPVNMRKRPSSAGGATPDGPASTATRPTTAVAIAVLMLISGLAAIATGLLLHGHHAYLVSTLTKNNPPITATEQSTLTTRVQQAVTSALPAGTSVTSTTVTSVGDKAADVLGDTDLLPKKNISDNDRKDQQSKLRDAVSAQLKGVSGGITGAQAGSIASSVAGTTRTNLATLNTDQQKAIAKSADSLPRSYLIQGIVVTIALGFVAFGVVAGRYWSRWGVPIVWVLCTFTSLPPGLFSLQAFSTDSPVGFKTATTLSSIAMLAALVLNFLRPTRAWYDAHRPVVAAGAPRRGGLFGPRVPPPTGGRAAGGAANGRAVGRRPAGKGEPPAEHAPAHGHHHDRDLDRAPAKRRTTTEAAAESTEPAAPPHTRPRQASKSRRTDG